MPRKFIDILHDLMTNQLVILAVAILLFLLVITLIDPVQSEAVIDEIWI